MLGENWTERYGFGVARIHSINLKYDNRFRRSIGWVSRENWEMGWNLVNERNKGFFELKSERHLFLYFYGITCLYYVLRIVQRCLGWRRSLGDASFFLWFSTRWRKGQKYDNYMYVAQVAASNCCASKQTFLKVITDICKNLIDFRFLQITLCRFGDTNEGAPLIGLQNKVFSAKFTFFLHWNFDFVNRLEGPQKVLIFSHAWPKEKKGKTPPPIEQQQQKHPLVQFDTKGVRKPVCFCGLKHSRFFLPRQSCTLHNNTQVAHYEKYSITNYCFIAIRGGRRRRTQITKMFRFTNWMYSWDLVQRIRPFRAWSLQEGRTKVGKLP